MSVDLSLLREFWLLFGPVERYSRRRGTTGGLESPCPRDPSRPLRILHRRRVRWWAGRSLTRLTSDFLTSSTKRIGWFGVGLPRRSRGLQERPFLDHGGKLIPRTHDRHHSLFPLFPSSFSVGVGRLSVYGPPTREGVGFHRRTSQMHEQKDLLSGMIPKSQSGLEDGGVLPRLYVSILVDLFRPSRLYVHVSVGEDKLKPG